MEELKKQGTFEEEEESKTRSAALCHLDDPSTANHRLSLLWPPLCDTLFWWLATRGCVVSRAGGSVELAKWVVCREIVLGRLASLVKRFVHKISLARGLSEEAATAAGGKIFTFGSYRLGVHGPGTDIDTLCVVPKHVSREDFFDVFEPMLKETEGATEVSVSV